MRHRATQIRENYSGGGEYARDGSYEPRNGYLGHSVPVCGAAKVLGLTHDDVLGPERWQTVKGILAEAGVYSRTDPAFSQVYEFAAVVALAQARGTDPFAFLAAHPET